MRTSCPLGPSAQSGLIGRQPQSSELAPLFWYAGAFKLGRSLNILVFRRGANSDGYVYTV